MEILKELNYISNQLQEAIESEDWTSVDEMTEQVNELIYRLSDGDLLHVGFED